jgi:hypothetical protein
VESGIKVKWYDFDRLEVVMTDQCGAVLGFWSPGLPWHMNDDNFYEYPCILETHTAPQHLLKISDTLYVVWERSNCGATDPHDECYEYCECYDCGEVNAEKAEELIAKQASRKGSYV